MSTNNSAFEKAITLNTLKSLKNSEEKFSCVALYDATMATLAANAGVETIIVGDSLGMTIQGHDSTLPVVIEDMVYHTVAVRRGNQHSLIIADLPFMAYATPEQAMANASKLIQAGAYMVKLEGGEWLCDTVNKLSQRGIPVCGHLGLTPQSVNKFGGYRVQGRDEGQAEKILADAQALQQAGADLLVLECVPSTLSEKIAKETQIITIGIGAGPASDGQVLVINDMLGMTAKPPKFSKNYLLENDSIESAMKDFVNEIKNGEFPRPEHGF